MVTSLQTNQRDDSAYAPLHAETYELGGGLAICVYKPDNDNNLPLVGTEKGRWRIINWSILPDMGGNPIYILFIFSDIRDNLTLPDSISFETSFKHCTLKLIPSSSPLPLPIKEIVFEGILSVAGSQSQEHIASLLGALSKVYPEDDALPRIPARLVSVSDRIYLHMDGCYNGFYIVDRNGEASRITAIRYTSAKSFGTILEIDSKPLARDLWLLGKGSFEALRLEQVVE